MPTEQRDQESSYEALKTERYLWMSRAFCVVGILALLANILLLVALGSLQPLTRIQPFLINIQDKDQQVIDIVRPKLENFNRKQLEESYVRQYILARYTIGSDLEELKRRWGVGGIIDLMTQRSYYEAFVAQEMNDAMRLAEDEGMTREVMIQSALKDDAKNQWIVKFLLTTKRQRSSEKDIRNLQAKLEVNFQTVRKGMNWEQRLKNPLGFTVTNYDREVLAKTNE